MMQSSPIFAPGRTCTRCQTFVPLPIVAPSSTSALGWIYIDAPLRMSLCYGELTRKPKFNWLCANDTPDDAFRRTDSFESSEPLAPLMRLFYPERRSAHPRRRCNRTAEGSRSGSLPPKSASCFGYHVAGPRPLPVYVEPVLATALRVLGLPEWN